MTSSTIHLSDRGPFNVLTLAHRVRPGSFGEQTGTSSPGIKKTERRYFDFVVDGQSLEQAVRARNQDLVGALGWFPEGLEADQVSQLLLEAESPIAGGRCMLFVCPECGDLGCGAISTKITRDPDGAYVWSEFRYENNYDPEMTDALSYAHLGPYRFDPRDYRQTLIQQP